MKSVIFFICCTLLICISSSNAFILHTKIGKFLYGIHGKIQNKTLEIPTNTKVNREILESAFQGFLHVIDDPLFINDQLLRYEMTDVVKLNGEVKNLHVKYLSKMVLDHVYISQDNLYSEFVIRAPSLEISGLYNSSFYVKEFQFDVYGNGSFNWTIVDFKIKVNFTLTKMRTGYMQLDKINFDQSIGSSKFEIKNLLNDEVVSSTVSDIVTIVIPPLHNYYKPAVNEFMVRSLALYSEVIFSNVGSKDFVGIIHAFKQQNPLEKGLAT